MTVLPQPRRARAIALTVEVLFGVLIVAGVWLAFSAGVALIVGGLLGVLACERR